MADNPSVPLDLNRIRELREQLGLSQQQAAERAGMKGGRQHWNKIEKGKAQISLTALERIARALGVSAKDLLK